MYSLSSTTPAYRLKTWPQAVPTTRPHFGAELAVLSSYGLERRAGTTFLGLYPEDSKLPLTHRHDARAHVTLSPASMTVLQGAGTTCSKLIDAHVFSICQGWR